jgi:SAM-dependent methyltransferase
VCRLRDGDRRRGRTVLSERDIVRRGYEAIAARYAEWRVEGNPAEELLRDLDDRLPDAAEVLELGCGNGRPGALILSSRHRYTGVDISREQLVLAREVFPDARFLLADYTKLDVATASLDAVAAILTLTHVPRREHGELLGRIAGWLRPGGLFLGSFGFGDTPGAVEEDWLGVPMYFSHFDADTNRQLVRSAGFELARDEVRTMVEEGHGQATFLWILARKPA